MPGGMFFLPFSLFFCIFCSLFSTAFSMTDAGVSGGVAGRVAGDDVEHARRGRRGDLDLFRGSSRSRERSLCLGQCSASRII